MQPSLLCTLLLAILVSTFAVPSRAASSLFALPILRPNQFYSGNIHPSAVADQTWQLPLPSDYPSPLFPGAVALKLRAAPLSNGGPLSFLISFSQNSSVSPLLLTLDTSDDWALAPLGCTVSLCAPGSEFWTLSSIQGDDPAGYYMELFVDAFPFTPRVSEREGETIKQTHKQHKHKRILHGNEINSQKAAGTADLPNCASGPPSTNSEINVLSLLNFSAQNQILVGNLQPALLQSTTLYLPVLAASGDASASVSGVSLTAYASSLDTQAPLEMCVAYRWSPAGGGAPSFANAQYVSVVNTAWTNKFVSCPFAADAASAQSSSCSEGGFVMWALNSAQPTPRGFDSLFVVDVGTFAAAKQSAQSIRDVDPSPSPDSLSLDCSAGFPSGWSVLEVSPVISYNQLLVGSMWPPSLGETAFLYRNQLRDSTSAAGSIGAINTSLVLTASSSDVAVDLSFCVQFVDATGQLYPPSLASIPAGDWVTVGSAAGSNQTGSQSGWLLWNFNGNSSSGYVVESFVDDSLFDPLKSAQDV